MCQKCFFAGQTSKSHKLTHPMQEYCSTVCPRLPLRHVLSAESVSYCYCICAFIKQSFFFNLVCWKILPEMYVSVDKEELSKFWNF